MQHAADALKHVFEVGDFGIAERAARVDALFHGQQVRYTVSRGFQLNGQCAFILDAKVSVDDFHYDLRDPTWDVSELTAKG